MTDIGKTIERLSLLRERLKLQKDILGYGSHIEDLSSAIALLKEQEAVAPKRIDGKRNHFTKCGNCNYDLMSGYHYCPHCGKAVKWDA